MNGEPIIIERKFDAPVEKVWKAITDKDQMKHWYFDLEAFKPEVGFEFNFTGGRDDRQYLHICRIIEVEPYKKLKHTWTYDGYEGMTHLSFELFEEGNGTKLKLTHSGLDSFPATNPDFAKQNFIEGWNHIINVSLKEHLEKK